MAKQFALGILTIVALNYSFTIDSKERSYSDSCTETLSQGLLKLLSETIDGPPKDARITTDLKKSLSTFCACKEKMHREGPELNWLDHSFKDPREFFDQDDQCALDTLSQADYHLLFLAQLKSRMLPLVQDRLHERYRSIATHVASPTSYNVHLSCVSDKVLIQCSRSLSLATTYLCVNNFLSSAGKIDHLEASCPSFRTEDAIEETDEALFAGPRI